MDGTVDPDTQRNASTQSGTVEEVIYHGFVSYSRRDTSTALGLIQRLEAARRSIAYDREDVHEGEAWRRKLTALIRGAQNVIVLISHASLESRECRWELDLAATLNKRLITVRIDAVDAVDLPESLSAVQWIDATEPADHLDQIASRILTALDTDQEWAEFHTRLTLDVLAWREHGALLRGKDLRNAEGMVARFHGKRPLPSADHVALLLASRTAARRRMRAAIAGAAVVAITIAALGVNWLAERRNAAFVELRRQGEFALNRLDGGDVAAAVASLGRVVDADRDNMLPEYRPVLDFWRAQLRPIEDVAATAQIGDLIDWRGRLYLKTEERTFRLLPKSAPLRIARSDDGKSVVVSDYSGTSLLALPGLEARVEVRFEEGRVQPVAIHAVPGTPWRVAVGSRTVVENDEDEPVRTESCFTLVMPAASVPDERAASSRPLGTNPDPNSVEMNPKASSAGAVAAAYCTTRRFTMSALSGDRGAGQVVLDGIEQGGEDSDDTAQRLQFDTRSLRVTRAALPREKSASAGAPPDHSSAIHIFPQTLGEGRAWVEVTNANADTWKSRLDARQGGSAEAQALLQAVDSSRLKEDEQPIFNQMGEALRAGVFTDAGIQHLWAEYISGNSYASIGVCKLVSRSRILESCRAHGFLVIGARGTAWSGDQRWMAQANGDSSLAPLDLVDLLGMKSTPLNDLPSLVGDVSFSRDSTRVAVLTETNEVWIYAFAHETPPRRLQRIALGGAARPICPASAERPEARPPSGIAFAGERTIVGLGVDGLLFGIDPATGDIRWRRPLETASIACPDDATIVAEGEFFAVHGRTFVQPFHATTGVPLGTRATAGEVSGSSSGGPQIEALSVTENGDVAVRIGGRVYVRRRPAGSSTDARDLERLTGIDSADGLTPLKKLSALSAAGESVK